jgi:hypothetical protein
MREKCWEPAHQSNTCIGGGWLSPKPRTTSPPPNLDGCEVTLTKSTLLESCNSPSQIHTKEAWGLPPCQKMTKVNIIAPSGAMKFHHSYLELERLFSPPKGRQHVEGISLPPQLGEKAAPSIVHGPSLGHTDLRRSAPLPRRTLPRSALLAPGKGRPLATTILYYH